ncbi:MAG: FAD-binding oxidoreductase, partial [Planctomycetota bacterium]|nr:FAD-binding oxidoreductase [Planctomycetota bacterium]
MARHIPRRCRRRIHRLDPMAKTAEVVICGAGMAGVAAAYELAVRRGVPGVVLIDEREPLTLTSDKGTEAYRNWWPGPGNTMARFMNRSIDLLDSLAAESDNAFELNRNGYAFLTADPDTAARMRREANAITALGGGPADFLATKEIHARYPFVAPDAVAMLHARRCGWLNAAKLGAWLLARAGVELVRGRVTGYADGAVALASGERIATGTFVLAPGPHLKRMGALLGIDLPVFCELHGKMATIDEGRVVPRDCPMMIWNDPIDDHPPGMHFRPRGERELLGIWTYDVQATEPTWPLAFRPEYGDVLLEGLRRMVPALTVKIGAIDGGYYCKTRENRPLIGPLPADGVYVIGALSGYGIMGSQAAADLLGAHITGDDLPDYAEAFLLERYDDPAYR